MERKVYTKLVAWKNAQTRKPLILEGARQVGKTWLMLEFARREYVNFVCVNFDKDTWAKSLFLQDYDISRILLLLEAQSGVHIEASKTLIIFDEIQEAERGLGVLKYFQEEAPQYHVIVAGSLLGLALHHKQSFPVGKVDILRVLPMTFVEFLYALGEDKKAKCIEECQWEVIASLMPIYSDLLRQYYYVGGMPEVVLSFVKNKDLRAVRTIQQNILTGYSQDISKHTSEYETNHILMVLQSLPSQLSKENKKFVYGLLRKGARAKDYELAIQWLVDAGLVVRVSRASEPQMPLSFYEELSVFKLFFLDVGLLGCLGKVPAAQILTSNNIFQEWKGAFTEQYVLQQLQILDLPIYYWSSNDSECEIDFLLQTDNAIVPIEVKAEDNVRGKSFKQFIQIEHPNLKGVRFSMLPYVDQGWMMNIPLVAVGNKN